MSSLVGTAQRFYRMSSMYKGSIALHLSKFKFPLLKNALCQDWMKLAPWFWRQGSLYVDYRYAFLLIQYYFTLEKARHFICITWIPFTQSNRPHSSNRTPAAGSRNDLYYYTQLVWSMPKSREESICHFSFFNQKI